MARDWMGFPPYVYLEKVAKALELTATLGIPQGFRFLSRFGNGEGAAVALVSTMKRKRITLYLVREDGDGVWVWRKSNPKKVFRFRSLFYVQVKLILKHPDIVIVPKELHNWGGSRLEFRGVHLVYTKSDFQARLIACASLVRQKAEELLMQEAEALAKELFGGLDEVPVV